MSELSIQIQARKQRLQRFAEAGARYQAKSQATDDVKQSVILERYLESHSSTRRRDYETATLQTSPTIARRILQAVSKEFEMPIESILARNNHPEYVLPRFVAIGLAVSLTRMSYPKIGRWLGGRDHTTVLSGRKRINALLESEAFRNRFDQIKAAVLAT